MTAAGVLVAHALVDRLAVVVISDVDAEAPQPAVAFSVYVVVACGCGISTNPTRPNVPMPAIETDPPVPEVSVTFQDKRTVWPPPIVTLFGFALNEFIVGEGHVFAVTVACAEDPAPHPDVAFRV